MATQREQDSTRTGHQSDEDMLAALGYKRELHRGMSGFSNFAVSFSIISVLAGCITTYYLAMDAGGPVAISVGWPLVGFMVGSVTGDPTAWHSDKQVVRLCTKLTWLLVLP